MSTQLPSLEDLNISKSSISVSSVKGDTEYERAINQFRADQENKPKAYKSSGVPIITLEMLKLAPRDFFDEFIPISIKVKNKIIDSISSKNNSALISALNADPTNQELKEKILFILSSELNAVARLDKDIRRMDIIEKDILSAMIANEITGLGPLEPLWQDKRVTEIMCNGPHDIQIEVDGIVHPIKSVKFRDKNHLMELINRLYSSINKSISRNRPSERGRLHDNSRMFAVHEVVAPDGPNFNIRKHGEEYWTPLDIINAGTASPELMHYLGNLIHSGVSFLVVGGTGTGKTTMLNSLTGFIPQNARVVTLEENIEMRPHPRKLIAAPMECVPARPGEGKEFGVTMRDLVRASLQMRPEYIIIGEVSDGAAYDLCQALNTGHSGASTVHANDAYDSINRLRGLVSQEGFVKGPAVLDLIGSAFDILVVVERLRDGSRKIAEVVELGRDPILGENDELMLPTYPLWELQTSEYEDNEGNIKIHGEWVQTGELSEYRQRKHRLELKKQMTWEELLEISTYNVPVELQKGYNRHD